MYKGYGAGVATLKAMELVVVTTIKDMGLVVTTN